MKRRKIALFLAAAMTVSTVGSVPVVSAEELPVIADEAALDGTVLDDAVLDDVVLDDVVLDDAVIEEGVAAEPETTGAEETEATGTEAAESGLVEEFPEEGLLIDSVEEVTGEEALELAAEADAAIAEAASQKPGQVANVRFDEKNPDVLKWDAEVAADGYEIEVKDSTGNVYLNYFWNDEEDDSRLGNYQLNGREYSSCPLGNLYLYAYTKDADGAWTQVWDGNGDSIPAFQAGVTYTIAVRAYNGTTPGDWSAPVQYTPAVSVPDKVANLTLELNGDRLSWYMDENADYYEISVEDAAGRQYFDYVEKDETGLALKGSYARVYSWNYSDGGERIRCKADLTDYIDDLHVYELKEGEIQEVTAPDPANPGVMVPVKPFEIGQAYTVKIRSVNKGVKEAENKYSDWSAPVTYVRSENALPGKVAGVEYEQETNNSYGMLTWYDVEDAYGYEIEVMDAAGHEFLEDCYYTTENGAQVLKKVYCNTDDSYVDLWRNLSTYTVTADQVTAVPDLQAFVRGQSYAVRVRAYNSAQDGRRQFGEWSDPLSFTYPLPGVSKVSAVSVNAEKRRLSWKKDEHADYYEIAVSDASGRMYYDSVGEEYNEASKKTEQVLRYWVIEKDPEVSVESAELYERLQTYVTVDGSYTSVIDADGETVHAFEDGETYAIQVRAVSSYTDAAGKNQRLYGDWSDAVSYTAPLPPKGINAKPAAVTGVHVQTTGRTVKENEQLIYEAQLRWDYVPGAQRYEIRVLDAAGHEFVTDAKMKDGAVKLEYLQYEEGLSDTKPSFDLSQIRGLKAYVKEPGTALATVTDPATGKDLKAIVPGQTWRLQVRAVNTYSTWDAAKKEYAEAIEIPGDWSAEVAYAADALTPITDLKFEYEKKGSYYFSYSAPLKDSQIWYQLATDASFSGINYWSSYRPGTSKFVIDGDDLEPGVTYYVRAVNSVDAPTDEEVAALAPAAVAFTTAAKAAKNIEGLELYKMHEDYAEFRFKAVLDDEAGDRFELQYTNKANPAETDWITRSREWYDDDEDGYNTFALPLSLLSEGQNYVRAVAYIWTRNAEGRRVKLYGVPSRAVPVTVSYATTEISKLKIAEKSDSGYLFRFTGTPRKNETVEYWYSEYADFRNDAATKIVPTSGEEFSISYTSLTPGKTYYVRARVKNDAAKTDAERYSAFTNVVKLTAAMPTVYVSAASFTSTTVTLSMSTNNNRAFLTGYEVAMKNGKKYETLAKTTDSTYKVSKLEKDTVYTFRVRPYFYNPETGKTKNGTWVYYQTTTWGGSMKLTAAATGKDSIKLKWNRISGAEGYEVYRLAGASAPTVLGNNATGKTDYFEKYTLVKTVKQPKKSKTLSYTDKSLTQKLGYSYVVRAYRTVDSKKYYIDDNAYASLKTDVLEHVSTVEYANGKVRVYWNPIYTAAGYLVEKYDRSTEKWVTVKTLAAKTSYYTYPKTTDNRGVQYRVRAYNKSKVYTNAIETTVYPYIQAPAGVKAKANSKSGYIKISWKPVAGADYYKVFRTANSRKRYDETTKTYTYFGGQEVPVYVRDASMVSGYRRLTDTKDLTATTVYDREITYTANGVTNTLYAGPSRDVKYYYYVIAYKNGKEYNYEGNYEGGTRQSASSKASASTLKSTDKISAPKIKSARRATGKATLKWSKVSGAAGYEVYRSENKKSGFEKIAAVTKGTTVSYVDKKANSGKTYYYKVRAYKYNNAGLEKYSSFSAVKTTKPVVKISAPTLKVKAGKKSVTLTWKKVKGAKGYVIYRSTKKSSDFEKVAAIRKGTTVKYVDNGLKSKTKYYYKICAYKLDKAKKNAYSADSAVKGITAK